MTDPRFDPFGEPVRRYEVAGVWSWVAGISLLLLIGFLIFAGWKDYSNTASSGSSPPTAASRMTPPSTTGSGSSSPQPITPAPSAPAPSKSGTQ